MSKRVAIIVANPGVSSTLGWPVGFWASELIHPYHEFIQEGYEVTIASPRGGEVKMDNLSDPRDESGYSSSDELSLKYLQKEEFLVLLKNTSPVSELSTGDFDAIVVAGGQSPMFTFEGEKGLHHIFSDFYLSGKPAAALCHGVAVLRWAVDGEGKPIVQGKKVTGFSNPEEDEADASVGQKIMPWRIQDELTELGADFVHAGIWEPFAVEDGNLITGQQQMSGKKVAERVIKQLEK
ncbi:MAG: type 1 glutamine amidotransferase domain-containing protein [Bacteroidetes bacterium]|jgi:putative intracellular protease/amidase|nr:type 1 glutamine amidotransferase domain-containing protein [Bacteroidota bacterium]